MSDQIIHAEGLSRLQDYVSHHEFAPLWIRYSEDHCFTNRRMLVNNCFDLTGVNILAARDNHILQAVQDVEVPVCILIADVSCSKHPVSERKRSCFRIIPITAHDIRAPGDKFTRLSGSNFLS